MGEDETGGIYLFRLTLRWYKNGKVDGGHA